MLSDCEGRNIFSDWSVNTDLRVKLYLLYFRVARTIFLLRIPIISRVFTGIYYAITTVVFNSELHPATKIGPRLTIYHPYLIIVNPRCIIGHDVTLRHGVTLGNMGGCREHCPVVGNYVDFAAFAAVLGRVEVPDNSLIKFRSLLFDR